MFIEKLTSLSGGETGQGGEFRHGLVRWTADGSVADIVDDVRERGLRALVFVDRNFFSDHERAIAMCRRMRALDVNTLWSAYLMDNPSRELLMEMRLAGCQRLEMFLEPELDAVEALEMAREFGFDISLRNVDGTAYACDRMQYTVAEREGIAAKLAGLHSVQFDLAVAYFKARRFSDVMLPLGKAMTLRFPMNELCLNLLACLSAAKHYPDMAAGLLQQAGYGCPHPVVFRNRNLLKSWLESGGDVKGVRLMLDPEGCPSSLYT